MMRKNAKPVKVDETAYPSVAAAARALGLNRKTIEHRVRKNLPITPSDLRPIPITVNGEYYVSIRAAAAQLGVKPGSLAYRIKKQGSYDISWSQSDARTKPLVIDGVTYSSRKEAARQLGLPYHVVQQAYLGA